MRRVLAPVLLVSLALAPLLAAPRTAQADEDDEAFLKAAGHVLKGSIRRARRAIAIGPTVGGTYVNAPESEIWAGSVSAGLSLYTFKVPILPDGALIKDMIKTRFKAKLIEAVKNGGKIDQGALLEEVVQEIKAEIMGTASFRSKKLERPRFALTWEGDYNLKGEVWSTRLRVGTGVSRTLVSVIMGGHFGDDFLFSLGGEIALLVLPGSGPRSPIFDVFVRGEFPVNDATDAWSLGLGVRLLVDII